MGHVCSWLQMPTGRFSGLCEEVAPLFMSLPLFIMAGSLKYKIWAFIYSFYHADPCICVSVGMGAASAQSRQTEELLLESQGCEMLDALTCNMRL